MDLIRGPPQVVILAGGLGTRLRPVTETTPKVMINILGKPFLEHKLNQIKNFGINDVVLCVGYLGNLIKDYFGNGTKFGVNIEYAYEKELLGTAGAIKNTEAFIVKSPFVVINGDTYSNINLKDLSFFHQIHAYPITMAITSATNPIEQELVEIKDNVVNRFYKRGTLEHKAHLLKNLNPQINAGAYVLDKNILNLIPRGKKTSLEMEIFPSLVGKIMSFHYRGYIKDIANIQFCEELKKDLIRGIANDN
jgi:mannose-1-phosphate guanylyltransferase